MLIQILIAIPLALLTLLGASQYYMMSQQAVTKVERQTSINTLHADAVHQAENVLYLSKHTTVAGMLPGMAKCLAGATTGCGAYAGAFTLADDGSGAQGHPTFNSSKDRSGSLCAGGGGTMPCVFTQAATARWICQDTECGSLQITLVTKDIEHTTGKYSTLSSTVNIPARAFQARGEMDGTCAAGQMVRDIDYVHLKVECQPIPGYNSTTNQYPARSVSAQSQGDIDNPPGGSSCGTGFDSLGLFAGLQLCAPSMTNFVATYNQGEGDYSGVYDSSPPPPPPPPPPAPMGGPAPDPSCADPASPCHYSWRWCELYDGSPGSTTGRWYDNGAQGGTGCGGYGVLYGAGGILTSPGPLYAVCVQGSWDDYPVSGGCPQPPTPVYNPWTGTMTDGSAGGGGGGGGGGGYYYGCGGSGWDCTGS